MIPHFFSSSEGERGGRGVVAKKRTGKRKKDKKEVWRSMREMGEEGNPEMPPRK